MRTLTPDQHDALTEIINIGVGRAASVLNQMVKSLVHLTVPVVKLVSHSEFGENLFSLSSKNVTSIRMGFSGSFSGAAALLFPPESAGMLVAVLTGNDEETTSLDSLRKETLNEVGNILINGVMGSITNICNLSVNYSFPTYAEEPVSDFTAKFESENTQVVLLAQTNFSVEEHLIKGQFLLIFDLGSFDALLESIDSTM